MTYNTDHLKTNKQFMIGNGILVFAVLVVVVLFLYLSFRESQRNKERVFTETYELVLQRGFAGRSVQLLMNDSVLFDGAVQEEPKTVSLTRFAENSSAFIVDNETETVSVFELSEQGGRYAFEMDGNEAKLLGKSE